MRRPSLYIAVLVLVAVLVLFPTRHGPLMFTFIHSSPLSATDMQQQTLSTKVSNQSSLAGIAKQQVGAYSYYRLQDLISGGIVQGKTDVANDVCTVTKEQHHVLFQRNIPVALDTGLYESMPAAPVFLHNECYLPEATVKQLVSLTDDQATENRLAAEKKVFPYNAKQLATFLSFLNSPIPGAHVSTVNSSLPGAPRTYRHGVHEGLDWYTFGTGKVINTHTPVLAMGTGVVVRADLNYKEMTTPARNKLLAIGSKNDGQTPPYILDKLRGRTVWVQFANGIMARYCHLSRIASEIKVGAKVKTGDIIGYVGNSGTSDGALADNNGLHLHLDIIIYGNWMWGKYTVAERRMILETVFNR